MLELEHGFRVIDVHVRLEPDAKRRGPAVGDPESVEREFRQAGVVRGVVFPPEREGGYLKANNAVARLSVGRPFVAFARLEGHDPDGSAGARLRKLTGGGTGTGVTPEDVEQFAYDDRFAGFRLHPVADGIPAEPAREEMEAVGLPVLTYGGQGFGPDDVADQLLEYDFPVVVSHFGGYPLDAERTRRAIDLLDSYDDLYLDTSYVRRRRPLERALREHPDRVVFGSGAPATHPNVAVMEILTLDVPEDAMRKAFNKNAARVIEEV